MEKLAAYLDRTCTTQRAFAASVQCHHSIISKILTGSARPGLDLAVRIERQTGGEVPAVSWIPDASAAASDEGTEVPRLKDGEAAA